MKQQRKTPYNVKECCLEVGHRHLFSIAINHCPLQNAAPGQVASGKACNIRMFPKIGQGHETYYKVARNEKGQESLHTN
jgi:hypothetical protein